MVLLLPVTVLIAILWMLSMLIFWKLYQAQMTQYQKERENWERERERLLNRAMTKEWSSYVQMTQAMAPTTSLEESPTPAKGLSDEEELRRFMGSMAAEGVGETVFDMTDDLRELGLIKESE